LDNGIDMIEFLGRVVGKALYEGILLDYSFSPVFVQKLLGRYNFLDELSTLDPELYRNLMQLKVLYIFALVWFPRCKQVKLLLRYYLFY
jgi:ubiquitin-protein ligase E3 B